MFWNYGIKHLGASNTSILFNLVPVFTVVISLAEEGRIYQHCKSSVGHWY
ncbi:EamA family transporter [Legionella sp. CNM-4043-24]